MTVSVALNGTGEGMIVPKVNPNIEDQAAREAWHEETGWEGFYRPADWRAATNRPDQTWPRSQESMQALEWRKRVAQGLEQGWHDNPAAALSDERRKELKMQAGERPGHPGFNQVLDEVHAMHVKKGADYGKQEDSFANVRASDDFGVDPWIGTLIRANDKMRRLQTAARGQALLNEGIEDSLLDLATYAIIALVLFREEEAVDH